MNKKANILAALAIVLATLAVYCPLANFAYLEYDDTTYVFDNPHVLSGLTARSVLWALTSSHAANWHPVTWISHQLDVSLWGVHPGLHHIMNLFYHILAALCWYAAWCSLTQKPRMSFILALVFAIHPLHVESVAWIAERKDVLSSLFAAATLWSYARFIREKRQIFYFYSLAFFLLGLASKPMLVTLPFVMILLDWWPLQQVWNSKKILLQKTPFFALSIASCFITFIVQKAGGAVAGVIQIPPAYRLSNAIISYGRYVVKSIFPHDLALIYPHPGTQVSWSLLLLSGICLSLITWIVWRYRLKFPAVLLGWLWFLGMLVPVIGLVQVGSQAMADRYMYLPLFGLTLMITALIRPDEWTDQSLRKGYLVLLFIAVPYIFLSHKQVTYWRDEISIFQHTLDVTEANHMAHNGLGLALAKQGRFAESVLHFEQVLKLAPGFPVFHSNYSNTLLKMGEFVKAEEQSRLAIALEPRMSIAFLSLGYSLYGQNRLAEAVEQFQHALCIDPELSEAYNNLGYLYTATGRYEDAVQQLQQALKRRPYSAESWNNLGDAYAKMGKIPEAVRCFKQAINLNPELADVYMNWAKCYESIGRPDSMQILQDQAARIKQQKGF